MATQAAGARKCGGTVGKLMDVSTFMGSTHSPNESDATAEGLLNAPPAASMLAVLDRGCEASHGHSLALPDEILFRKVVRQRRQAAAQRQQLGWPVANATSSEGTKPEQFPAAAPL